MATGLVEIGSHRRMFNL